MNDVALAMGPDALRAPAGPLPADPAEDANLPPELLALKQAAETRFAEWQASGRGLGASSLVDAARVLLQRSRRRRTPRYRDHLLPDRRQRGFSADDPQHRYRTVLRRSGKRVASDAENLIAAPPPRAAAQPRARSSSTAPIPPSRRRSA